MKAFFCLRDIFALIHSMLACEWHANSCTIRRVLALMPHPERTIMAGVGSYIPKEKLKEWGDLGPWARIFQSARRWVG